MQSKKDWHEEFLMALQNKNQAYFFANGVFEKETFSLEKCLEAGRVLSKANIIKEEAHFIFVPQPEPRNVLAALVKSLEKRVPVILGQPILLSHFRTWPEQKEYICSQINACFGNTTSKYSLNNCIVGVFTSGTTSGLPKLVLIPNEILMNQIEWHRDVMTIQPETHRLSCLPLGHSFGLVLDFLLGFLSNQIITFSENTPKEIVRAMEQRSFHNFATVPRVLDLVLKNLEKTKLKYSIPSLHTGGAKLTTRLVEKSQLFFPRIFQGYGLTEAGPGVFLGDSLISGMQIRINETGHLCILKENLCLFAEKNANTDEWYNTQDIVSFQNSKIYIEGRNGRVTKGSCGTWINLANFAESLKIKFNFETCTVYKSDLGFHIGSEYSDNLVLPVKLQITNIISEKFGSNSVMFHKITENNNASENYSKVKSENFKTTDDYLQVLLRSQIQTLQCQLGKYNQHENANQSKLR